MRASETENLTESVILRVGQDPDVRNNMERLKEIVTGKADSYLALIRKRKRANQLYAQTAELVRYRYGVSLNKLLEKLEDVAAAESSLSDVAVTKDATIQLSVSKSANRPTSRTNRKRAPRRGLSRRRGLKKSVNVS